MPNIFYTSKEIYNKPNPLAASRKNANVEWATNTVILQSLQRMAKTEGNFMVKLDIEKEIQVALRNIEFWGKRPNFNPETAPKTLRQVRRQMEEH